MSSIPNSAIPHAHDEAPQTTAAEARSGRRSPLRSAARAAFTVLTLPVFLGIALFSRGRTEA